MKSMLTSMGRPLRHSVRLVDFDYASDCIYFITICSERRRLTFGSIRQERIVLSPLGVIMQEEWLRSEIVRPGVRLGDYQIMPNHFHALLFIPAAPSPDLPTERTGPTPRPKRSLSSLIAQFKASVTKRSNSELGFERIWQRGFFEQVVRNSSSLESIERYIAENPMNWPVDPDNLENKQ